MKILSLFLFVSIICGVTSCYDDAPPSLGSGSIMFTSSHDCKIFLVNCDSVTIAGDYYEIGKAPLIVYMKEIGDYIVFAETNTLSFKNPLVFLGGHIEYFIEF